VLDRIALIATLIRAILLGAVMGALSVFRCRVNTFVWLFAALALASCVILTTQ
jgi:hypothetical protein